MAAYDVATLSREKPLDKFSPLVFPKTRCSLWDKTSKGHPVVLHINHYRKPRVCIPEKILKLVQHQCENYGQAYHVLLGTLVIDDDGEGVQVQVDRLDTRPNVPINSSNLTSGSVLIQLKVTNNTASDRDASLADYIKAFQQLQDRCCSKEIIDMSSFFVLRGWATFYSNAYTSVAHLDFDMVTVGTVFESTPITPVPIVLTGLSKFLAGPRNLNIQETPKTGYLTMDQTRKLVLVLEFDPKVAAFPIVGIWVSGIQFLQHPFVWAACLRYVHSTHLQERVCMPPDEFLLLLYTPLHSRPEFYQVISSDISMQFELSSGHEVINMDKALTSPSSSDFVEVEMEHVQSGPKIEIFAAATETHRAGIKVETSSVTLQEDLEPRCAPKPHSEKLPIFRPVVPDVSVCVQAESPNSGLSLDGSMQHQQPQEIVPYRTLEYNSRPAFSDQTPFSPLNLAVPAGRPQFSGLYPQYLARPLLSAGQLGQILPLSAMDILHSSPQAVVTSHSGHSLSESGLSSPGSCQTNSHQMSACSTPSNGTPRSVATSESALACSPSSGNAVIVDFVKRTSSNQCYQNSAGAAVPLVPSLPVVRDGGYKILEEPTCGSHAKCQPSNQQQDSRMQCSCGCHLAAGKSDPTLSVTPPARMSRMGTADGTKLNHLQSQHVANTSKTVSSSTKNHCCHRATLQTVVEEASPASSGSHSVRKPDQQFQGLPNKNILENLNGSLRRKEVDESSLHQASSISSSERYSGEDSGLSITPERDRSDPREHGSVQTSSTPQSQIGSKTWELIPPEVRALLVEQSEKLHQLQQQVELLQAQQSVQARQATGLDTVNEAVAGQRSQAVKYSSVAVNTVPMNDVTRCHRTCGCGASETKPSEAMPHKSDLLPPSSKKQECHSQELPFKFEILPAAGITISDSQSTSSQSLQASSRYSIDDINQEDLEAAAADVPTLNYSAHSAVSCQLLDVTESASDRSQHLTSVSHQDEEDLNSSADDDAADFRTCRAQLEAVLAMFSNQNVTPKCPVTEEASSTPEITSLKLESTSCSAYIPDVSTVSMHLDPRSETWRTVDINTLAMKYLSDEHLTRVAKLHQSGTPPGSQQWVINSMSIAPNLTATPDVSCLGLSPYDITVGTQMYLEKHGLLGNDTTVMEPLELGRELRLRTDFSVITNGTVASQTCYGPPTTSGKSRYTGDIFKVEPCSVPSQDLTTEPTQPECGKRIRQ